MINQAAVLSSLLYLAAIYPVISFFFRDSNTNKKKALWTGLVFVAAGLAIKLGYEISSQSPNYYSILEVSRQSSALEIRQAYKKVSKKLHPDKNTAANAEEQFQQAKTAYDVLMDETQRDVYNRFGEESLQFDPRHDELKLLSGLGGKYIFWIVCAYIFTLPVAARASRTWIAIVGVVMLIVEVSLCLTESAIPKWMPSTLTEQELMRLLHAAFPGLVAAFRCLAESLYVDIDKTSLAVLAELTQHQKAMNGLLHQLQVVITATCDKNQTQDATSMETVNDKIAELRELMEQSNESTTTFIDALKNSSSNPGSNYYWLIFVALYGGIYFLQ